MDWKHILVLVGVFLLGAFVYKKMPGGINKITFGVV